MYDEYDEQVRLVHAHLHVEFFISIHTRSDWLHGRFTQAAARSHHFVRSKKEVLHRASLSLKEDL
jgi:hypothetical protein